MENISQVIEYIKKEQPHSLYTTEFHKPLNAYLKFVVSKDDNPIAELFENIETVYEVFDKQYSPTTTRNYIRLLKQTFDILACKIGDEKKVESIANTFKAIIKKADKNSNASQKQQKQTEATDQTSESEYDFPEINLKDIQQVHVHKQVTPDELQESYEYHELKQLKVYCADLEVKYKILEEKYKMLLASELYNKQLVQQSFQTLQMCLKKEAQMCLKKEA